ncbi:MAG: hypothetical protein HY898_28685 [Deltaproteobacteria bacterium]|nr:hypothetical protein [Deltaproteobacteria bacterium]
MPRVEGTATRWSYKAVASASGAVKVTASAKDHLGKYGSKTEEKGMEG